MLKTIVGNETAAEVLLFLGRRGELYATELAKGLEIPVNMVQKQLNRFEMGGLLKSEYRGKKKIYFWNKAHPLCRPLKDLLTRANAVEAEDPADGTRLIPEERIELSEGLWREAKKLAPRSAHRRPFAKSFDSFKTYESQRHD